MAIRHHAALELYGSAIDRDSSICLVETHSARTVRLCCRWTCLVVAAAEVSCLPCSTVICLDDRLRAPHQPRRSLLSGYTQLTSRPDVVLVM
jgi:hypothetical protein